jgi:hypothetical protein
MASFPRSKLHVFFFFLLLFVVGSTALIGLSRNTLHAAAPSRKVQGAWKGVRSPSLGKDNNALNSVAAISKHDVWAIGSYYDESKTLIEHWNGTRWSVVPSPSIGAVLYGITALAINNVWAVGAIGFGYEALIEHWNGRGWSVVSSPVVAGNLLAVTAVSANNVWAVGQSSSNNVDEALIEHWNGRRWSVIPGANLGSVSYSGLGATTAISANNIWAVGSDSNGTLTEHWNGRSWSVVPSPSPVAYSNIELTGVTAVSTNDVWAVGSYFQAVSPYAEQVLIEHWDGTTWSIVTSPNSTYDAQLTSVVARSADDIWAVGRYSDTVSLLYRPLIEHWDGSSWSVVPSANRPGAGDTELNAIARVPGASDLWSVGDDQTGPHYGAVLTLTEHSL